jgi:hypothetical protein
VVCNGMQLVFSWTLLIKCLAYFNSPWAKRLQKGKPMKKNFTWIVLLCLTFMIPSPVFAVDVCEVVICMYGKVTGNSPSGSCIQYGE